MTSEPSPRLLSLPHLLLLLLMLASPARLTPAASGSQVRGQRSSWDQEQDAIKVVISDCATQGDASDSGTGGREIDLSPGSPLVLTHKIKLVPSSSGLSPGPGSGFGSGSCGCEVDLAALLKRVERLEKEASALREKCDGGCCPSVEHKGAGCSTKTPEVAQCPGDCSDQGRCVGGVCSCFPGFTGPDCSIAVLECPENCNGRGQCKDGDCQCDAGFGGLDCSEKICPRDCSDQGRCVDGRCQCDAGFTGLDCSSKDSSSAPVSSSCPGNCKKRGRCVSGLCQCDPGFTGPDCSEKTCPGNCKKRGRCVSGLCQCDPGFTGPDCSEKTCPGNCNNRGRCVSGLCQCDPGFTGPDCSEKTCPGNCNNKGRCIQGRCSCPAGFSGPDCSQCQEGKTGADCDIDLSGVSQLTARDVTDTSVTLFWTPPQIQYKSYHITFTSEKDSDEVTATVEGHLNTFTQTGLAAGQQYTATISGELDGQRGTQSSTQFMTIISGPTNLQVIKTSTTSAVVQWEPAQSDIDRYRLTVRPSDGAGTSQEVTVPRDQSSSHIQQLEAGRLYDVVLVAEKGSSRSEPAATQVTPGKTQPSATAAVSSRQVTLSPGNDGISKEIRSAPPAGGVMQQEKRDQWREVNYGRAKKPKEDPVAIRTRPSASRKVANHGTRPKLSERSPLPKKTNEQSSLHLNKTRFVPGARRVWPSALRKNQVAQKHKQMHENRTTSLLLKDPEVEAFTSERSNITKPFVKPASQGDAQGSITNAGPNQQPDAGMLANSSDSSSSSPKQEKKCLNKIKVTHIKLPHKEQRGSGMFTRDGAALVPRKTPPSSSDSEDSSDSSAVSDSDYSPDPFNKLLTDSLTNLNITTFYLGQSKPSDHSADSEAVGEQVFDGDKQSGYLPPAPVSPSTSPTPTTAPEMPRSHASINLSSNDKSSSGESKEPNANIRQVLPEDKKQPVGQRSSVKSGLLLRTRPSVGVPHIKGRLNSKSSHHSSPHSNLPLQTQNNSTFFQEVKTSGSLPASDESLSIEEVEQTSDVKGLSSVATTRAHSEDEKQATPTETSRIPARRLPLRRGFVRRPIPNILPLRNRTHPNVRILPGPFKRLKNASDRSDQELIPSRVTATLAPSEDFNRTESTKAGEEEHHEAKTNISIVLRQSTPRGASSYDPSARVGFYRRPPLNGGQLINYTNRKQQPPRQHGQFARSPFAFRRPTGQAAPLVRNHPGHLEEDATPQTQGTKVEKQVSPKPTETAQHRQAEDTLAAQKEGHGSDNSPHTEREKHLSVQTTNSKEAPAEVRDLDAETDNHNQRVKDGKGSHDQIRPQARQPFSSSRQRSPKLVRPSVKVPLTRNSLLNKYINRTTNRNNTKMNNTAKSLLFESETEPTKEAASIPHTGSDSSYSESTGEPLENVAVTNRTSKGFTLTWDSPKGTYEKFVVTRKAIEKHEDTEQGGALKGEPRNVLSVKGSNSENTDKENRLNKSVTSRATGDKPFQKVLASSARSFHFAGLPPQTDYTVTLLGKGPGLLSRLHKLVISTGPEPPKDIVFSEVTENSLTVSWTKPKSPVSGFKITYTHLAEGEPVSVSVDSNNSTLGLSRLSPGSTYEINVISVLGLDESDPIGDLVTTPPDPPTDLRAINVTDTGSLLLWRPALAAVDQYDIVYGSGTGSELRLTVSGNTAEQKLNGLEASTTYTVTISSLLGGQKSSPTTTMFTTTATAHEVGGEGLRDLKASDVTPRTALLSWIPPTNPGRSYRLTYQTEGHEVKEVVIDGTVTQYSLIRLHPGSVYVVRLQAEDGHGGYEAAVSTKFTTGSLKFPFPSDCSQELLNGIRTSGEVEIFPHGKLGTPVEVYCDMETDGGGWTVFQRRKDGSVDFFRGWKDYVTGFGDLSGEFWLGLDILHNLTAMTPMSLRVDLRDKDDSVFAKYSTFEVAKRNYKLTVGGYSGTAGDSLTYHSGRLFSTKDRDPTPFITRCAMSYRGGWWYKNCHEANLNGLYGIDVNHQGVIWTSWRGKEVSIPFSEMKMRPAAFSPPPQGG